MAEQEALGPTPAMIRILIEEHFKTDTEAFSNPLRLSPVHKGLVFTAADTATQTGKGRGFSCTHLSIDSYSIELTIFNHFPTAK